MAHWAKLDETNIVIDVTVGNNDLLDEGYQWLIDNIGGRWIKTSYNTKGGIHLLGGTPLRKNYAGIGFVYDEIRDAFIPPKPVNIILDNVTYEPVLNEESCLWEFPSLPDEIQENQSN